MKVLYVEDNEEYVYVVQQRLTRAGYTVQVEGLIEAEDMGALALQGFLKPVPAVNVVGLKA